MSSLKKHYIIPLEREGSAKNENVIYWPPTISDAWRQVFGHLTPIEADYFIRLVSTPGIYFNEPRLNQFRREAVILQNEDMIRDRGAGLAKHDLSRHLIAVNINPDPKIERVNVTFSEHHINPSSRNGSNDPENLALWLIGFHAAYHTLFANLRLMEVTECIRMMTRPNPHAPFKLSHSFLDYIRQEACERVKLKRYLKHRLRFAAKHDDGSDQT